MIDLHCHILPGLDDGALDMEDSVAMAREGAGDGIEIVCATPHIRHDHDVRIHQLEGRVAEVNERLEREDVPLRVVTGGEVAETALPGLDTDELRSVSLGGGGSILLEPAPGPLGDSLLEATRELRDGGFGVLIAHPERHPAADLADRLRDLVEAGALVQVTAAHLAGGPASETMLDFAGKGLVHVVASDAHSSHGGRPLRTSEGIEALRRVDLVRPHLDWITRDGPVAILRGEPVEPPFQVSS